MANTDAGTPMEGDGLYKLILIATHGRSGLGALLLGSTALAVVHRATVPVLLVR